MALKSSLVLKVEYDGEQTVLRHSFARPPFKIAMLRNEFADGDLHLMVMSASPGILNGDDYTIDIDIDAGASLHLHSQAYQRLYHMRDGARQQVWVKLREGSKMVYLPHPVVPHRASHFQNRLRIDLTADSQLVWGEVFCCGRKQEGERFLYKSYYNLTEIYVDQQLKTRELILIEPAIQAVDGPGFMEGYAHQSTLFIIMRDAKNMRDSIISALEAQDDLQWGISELQVPGLIVRMLGNSAEELYDMHQRLGAIAIRFSSEKKLSHA